MPRPRVRLLPASLPALLLGASLAACAARRAPRAPSGAFPSDAFPNDPHGQLALVRFEARILAGRQEAYFADAERYAADAAALDSADAARGARPWRGEATWLRVLGDARGWSATVSRVIGGRTVSCVAFGGDVETRPRTAGGVAAGSDGEPACDTLP